MSTTNAKGDLLAHVANTGLDEPHFDTTQDGPPHAPRFLCTVMVGDVTARGEGRTKRDAERAAALNALNTLRGGPAPVNAPAAGTARPPLPVPIYAEVLAQALIVAHERTLPQGSLSDVRRHTVALYSDLLRDLGALDE